MACFQNFYSGLHATDNDGSLPEIINFTFLRSFFMQMELNLTVNGITLDAREKKSLQVFKSHVGI